MTRNKILAAGTILWGIVAVDAIIHLASGDWTVPAIVGFAGVLWVAIRRPRPGLAETA
jgi:hypothetical protein